MDIISEEIVMAKWNWEKKIVEMNFETWKTKMISQMKERKQYGA